MLADLINKVWKRVVIVIIILVLLLVVAVVASPRQVATTVAINVSPQVVAYVGLVCH